MFVAPPNFCRAKNAPPHFCTPKTARRRRKSGKTFEKLIRAKRTFLFFAPPHFCRAKNAPPHFCMPKTARRRWNSRKIRETRKHNLFLLYSFSVTCMGPMGTRGHGPTVCAVVVFLLQMHLCYYNSSCQLSCAPKQQQIVLRRTTKQLGYN